MAGQVPTGHVVLWDDDHYYMGGVLAELLVRAGCTVTFVTTSAYVSDWTINTLEQHTIQRRLLEMGVTVELNRGVTAIAQRPSRPTAPIPAAPATSPATRW